jgi:hypothetical protein
MDDPEPIVPVAWHFSATAVAIHFLKQLSRTERMRIRGTIIIREQPWGVAYPESHVRSYTVLIREPEALYRPTCWILD